MNNFERFTKWVVAGLENRFNGERKLYVERVTKNNGIMLTGLTAIKNDKTVSPVIYLEDYFERYEEGVSIEIMVNEIYDMFNTFEKQDFPFDTLEDFKNLGDRVFYKLVNYEKNKVRLKNMPHIPYLDLAVVFSILLERNESGQFMAQIENKHMAAWGTDLKTLYALAQENTPKLFPGNLESMADIMKEIAKGMGDRCREESLEKIISAQETNPLYVLTNKSGVHGAAAILYKGVLKDFAEELEKDLVILPSSIHETILIPYEERLDMVSIREMVRTINRAEVSESEVLSDNVYMYKRETNSVEMA